MAKVAFLYTQGPHVPVQAADQQGFKSESFRGKYLRAFDWLSKTDSKGIVIPLGAEPSGARSKKDDRVISLSEIAIMMLKGSMSAPQYRSSLQNTRTDFSQEIIGSVIKMYSHILNLMAESPGQRPEISIIADQSRVQAIKGIAFHIEQLFPEDSMTWTNGWEDRLIEVKGDELSVAEVADLEELEQEFSYFMSWAEGYRSFGELVMNLPSHMNEYRDLAPIDIAASLFPALIPNLDKLRSDAYDPMDLYHLAIVEIDDHIERVLNAEGKEPGSEFGPSENIAA
jgi:hypothetical protein